MSKFRKRPSKAVDAFQVTRNANVPEWFADAVRKGTANVMNVNDDPEGEVFLEISYPDGVMIASEGDYVIRAENGDLYPCRAETFEYNYELDE